MDTKRLNPQSQTLLSPSSSGRRRTSINTSDCTTTSPEFEFWMVRNPSFPQLNILSADELFVDGVLLPLPLSTHNKPDPEPRHPGPARGPHSSASITDFTATTLSSSKRWKHIFRKSDKKNTQENLKEEEGKKKKKKKKERKGGVTTSAELNINIWPFSRSRSAGTRPKLFPGAPSARKVNSAPCSRSNSAGESNSRKWPSSPGRAGIHLGRSSPVWQVRRGGSTSPKNTEPLPLNPEKGSKRKTTTIHRSKLASSSSSSSGGSGSAKGRVLNLNVPMCIGYRQHLSCRSEENSASGVSEGSSNIRSSSNGGDVHGNGNGNVGSKLFNLRSLFTKKSLVTSH